MTEHLHTEPPNFANEHRVKMLAEVQSLVARRQREAISNRKAWFKPSMSSIPAYERSLTRHRQELRNMLGWPLTVRHSSPQAESRAKTTPRVERKFVAEDSLGQIWRVWIPTLPGVRTYGLYFRPPGKGPFPLVISQHGGAGTPEICSSFFDSSNYHDMTRRVLRRGMAVFAPQLQLWAPESFGPPPQNDTFDRKLKQLGGSMAALELYRLQRSLDALTRWPDIDANRVGMIGLSYGGFYTLFAAALDTRIKVAVSSCFFNDRLRYDFPDWAWFNSANRYLDAEVAAMVCPRPLYIEVGKKDDLFEVPYARSGAREIQARYRRLKVADRLVYHEHEGGHALDQNDAPIDFLVKHV